MMRIMAAMAVSMMASAPFQAWADASGAAAAHVEILAPRVQDMCSNEYAARLSSIDSSSAGIKSMWVPGLLKSKLTPWQTLEYRAAQVNLWFNPRPAELEQAAAWAITIAETVGLWILAVQKANQYSSALPENEQRAYLVELEETFTQLSAAVELAKCLQPSPELALAATEQGKIFLSNGAMDGDLAFTAVLHQVDCTQVIDTMEVTIATYHETPDLDQLGSKIQAAMLETFVPFCDKEKLQ